MIGADANILAAESGSAYVAPTRRRRPCRASLPGPGRCPGHVHAGQRPGERGVDDRDGRHDHGPLLGARRRRRARGPGLTAQYWHTPSFTGPPAVTRVERQVNYDLGFPSTFPGWTGAGTQVPVPPFDFFLEQQAVRYDGFLIPPATGDYVLSLTGWGDATLSLDGTAVIDMTGQDGRRVVDTPALHLVAGQRYALHIDYRATRPLTGLQPGTLLLQWRTPAAIQAPGIRQAVAAASDADVAVVYVRDFETEERDRVSLKLPQSADLLVRAVSAVNPHTVVVLATGGPVTMPWLGSVGRRGADLLRRPGARQRARRCVVGGRLPTGEAHRHLPAQRAGDTPWPGEPVGRHRRPGHQSTGRA